MQFSLIITGSSPATDALNWLPEPSDIRLGSLLESLVFAKRAAKKISEHIDDTLLIDRIINLDNYDKEKLAIENKQLIMDEIKRKDGEFYDKWCKS